jgi:hypothetical protein
MSDDGDDDDDAFQHKLQVLISGVFWSFFLRKRVVLNPHPTTGKTLHGDNNKRYLLATLPQTFWTPFLFAPGQALWQLLLDIVS